MHSLSSRPFYPNDQNLSKTSPKSSPINTSNPSNISSLSPKPSKEKLMFLNSLSQNPKQTSIINQIINEEISQLNLINKHNSNLKQVNLIESITEKNYDWKTLFKNTVPLSEYTHREQVPQLNSHSHKKIFLLNQQQFPNSMRYSSQINQSSENNISDNSLYINEYAHQKKKNPHLLSKIYKGYFTEDKHSFNRKAKLLNPKITYKSDKIKSAIKLVSHKVKLKENHLKEISNIKDSLNLNKQNLITAGCSGYVEPLLRSIYKQIHPSISNSKIIHQKTENKIPNKINKSNEIVVQCSTYNIHDPLLKIFSQDKISSRSNSFTNKPHKIEKIQIETTNPTVINKNSKDQIIQQIPLEINNTLMNHNNNLSSRLTNLNINTTSSNNTVYNTLSSSNYIPLCSINYHKLINKLNLSSHFENSKNGNDYISCKIFPIKTDTSIQNITFQKINEQIKKKSYLNDSAYSENEKETIQNKPRPYTSFHNKALKRTINQKNDDSDKTLKHKKVIEVNVSSNNNSKENDLMYFKPMKLFNTQAKLFYSSSNNYIIKKKRKNNYDFIKTNEFYTKKEMEIQKDNITRIQSAKLIHK